MNRAAITSLALALGTGAVSVFFLSHARSTGDIAVAWIAGALASWSSAEMARALRGGAP